MADGLVGQEVPDFQLNLLDGSTTTMHALFEEGKPVALDIYADEFERLAGENPEVKFVFINCSGGAEEATGFGSQHNITNAMHAWQENIPPAFGLQYIPHKVVIGTDKVVIKNYSFSGTSLAQEIAKLKE